MAKFRLIKLVESRIRGDLYVRFGGEHLETYHRNVARRRMLSLHNQCILSPERVVSNYGKNKVSTEGLFEQIDEWLADFDTQMTEDRNRIERLKSRTLTPMEVYAVIGLLTTLRVSHDSTDKRLSSQVETYPLNQSQISVFTENLLKLSLERQELTAWDLYNVATEIYKPGRTDIPAAIPQNSALAELLLSEHFMYKTSEQ